MAHIQTESPIQFGVSGLAAGLWYATVEILLVAQQQQTLPPGVAQAVEPAIEGAVACTYGAFGGLIGLLAGGLFRSRITGQGASRGLVALILLVPIELAVWGEAIEKRDFVTHGVIGVLIILSVVSVRGRAARPLSSLLHPLPLSLLVLAVPIVKSVLPDLEGAILLVPVMVWAAAITAVALRVGRFEIPGKIGAAVLAGCLLLSIAVSSSLEPRLVAQRGSAKRDALNVVVVTFDTVRADHTSVYGYDQQTTPNLDALAESSIVFERAYSASDLTLPSHASLFTGVPVRTHGARADADGIAWGRGLDDRFETLAERFSALGFATYGIASNAAVINPRNGLTQGFAYFDGRLGAEAAGADTRLVRYSVGSLLTRLGVSGRPYRTADEIRRSTLRVVEAASHSEPFFLFVNWMDAHYPYRPPEPYASQFAGRDPASRIHDWHAAYKERMHGVLSRTAPLIDGDIQHLFSQYDGGIAYEDAELAAVFDRMRELGLLERTILFVTADHGEAFGEHATMSHGVSVYDEQVRVPAILKVPGVAGASRVETPVSTSAIAALLPELATAPAGSREAIVRNAERQVVVSESYPEAWLMKLTGDVSSPLRAIVSEQGKLIRSDGRPPEFYDFQSDPLEHAPAAAALQQASALSSELDRWLEHNPEGEGKAVEIDTRTQDALEALGYVVEIAPAGGDQAPPR